MSDPTSYNDESETAGQVFCISGYLAPADEWEKLEVPWRTALREEDLCEFKMQDCEQGHGDFKTRSRPDRTRLQGLFISLAMSVNLHAFVTGIDLKAYGKAAPLIKRKRAMGYWKPYLLAFQHQLELMATRPPLAPDEEIAFIFDEQQEFKGKAKALFDSVKRSRRLDYVARLGGLAFLDSIRHVQIQAADILAYEARRHLIEVVYSTEPLAERWQWQRLREESRMDFHHFPEGSITEYLRVLDGEALGYLEQEDA
jgi:hypothetical protein